MNMKKMGDLENKVTTTMQELQKAILDLTGLDPRGGQIGPLEIYKCARKAAEDVIKEQGCCKQESTIIRPT